MSLCLIKHTRFYKKQYIMSLCIKIDTFINKTITFEIIEYPYPYESFFCTFKLEFQLQQLVRFSCSLKSIKSFLQRFRNLEYVQFVNQVEAQVTIKFTVHLNVFHPPLHYLYNIYRFKNLTMLLAWYIYFFITSGNVPLRKFD